MRTSITTPGDPDKIIFFQRKDLSPKFLFFTIDYRCVPAFQEVTFPPLCQDKKNELSFYFNRIKNNMTSKTSSQSTNFLLPSSLAVWPLGSTVDVHSKATPTASANKKFSFVGSKKKEDIKPKPSISFMGNWMGANTADPKVDDNKKNAKKNSKEKQAKKEKKAPSETKRKSSKSTSNTKKKDKQEEPPATNILTSVLGSINIFDGEEKSEKEETSPTSLFNGWSMAGKTKEAEPVARKSTSSSLLNKWTIVGGKAEEAIEIQPADSKAASTSLLSRWIAIETEADNSKAATSKQKSTSKQSTADTLMVEESKKQALAKGDRPSIYEEAMEMLTAALLIYTFADLRKMAREGEIVSKGLEADPIAIGTVMEVIRTHREALQKRAKIDENDLEARLKALKDIQKQQLKSSTVMGRMLRGAMNKETVLTRFHDEKSTQGMVYGIAVNHIRRRVTIIFRGSVTQKDFVTDAKFSQKKVANPLVGLGGTYSQDMPTTINVHTGFYEYLFQKDDEGIVRLDHLLSDARILLKKNPGYRLFCTGHSLGGALATMCGFYAALDDQIVKNGAAVVVYSIASPRVGNSDFRRSFQVLGTRRLLLMTDWLKVYPMHSAEH